MSSGYVTTNIPRKPDRVKSKKLGVSVNLSAASIARPKFSVNDYVFANPITSYRSGPSYEREVRKPGAVFSTRNLDEFLVQAAGDIGHEFSCQKVTEFYGNTWSRRPDVLASPIWSQLTNPTMTIFARSAGNDLQGNVFLDRNSTFENPRYGFAKSDSELVTLGTSFIKETNPIQSQVNLLSDIAEAIADGALLPGLLGKSIVSSVINPNKRRGIIHSIGGEYLNYIFGYKPLASDIAKVGVLIDTVNSIVDQWIKDSGTIVRRRRKVPTKIRADKDVTWTPAAASGHSILWYVPLMGSFPSAIGPQDLGWSDSPSTMSNFVSHKGFWHRTVSSDVTFSAGYEYDFNRIHLPVEGGSAADLMHNSALRGELTAIAFGLDPASIGTAAYDAVPFSWLLDWFVNIGDILDNFRGLQARGVQMLWGYVSETAVRDSYFEWQYTWTPTANVFFRTNGFYAQKAIRRIRATPFGFGTSFGSLTASQSATLAALAAAKSG